MGYELKLYIGEIRKDYPDLEYVKDLNNPFTDGSGYPHKKDENDQLIPTGRIKYWLNIFGMIDLCKVGYNSPLSTFVQEKFKEANDNKEKSFVYFYGTDGNTEIFEDKYGDYLAVAPLTEIYGKLLETIEQDSDYRRYAWTKGFIEGVLSNTKGYQEEIFGVFYGY